MRRAASICFATSARGCNAARARLGRSAMNKRTIRDLTDAEVRGRRALVRVDFNVPLDDRGAVTDDTRMRAAMPTLDALSARGARRGVAVAPRPSKGEARSEVFARAGGAPLGHAHDATGSILSTDGRTRRGAGDDERSQPATILLMENTRFLPGEEKNDDGLARQIAELGDFYVNDAFGSAHRAHASTEGVAHHPASGRGGVADGRRARVSRRRARQPEASVHRDSGRRQDLRQDRRDRGAAAEGRRAARRRCDGMHVLPAMGLETGTSLVERDRVDMAKDLLARAIPAHAAARRDGRAVARRRRRGARGEARRDPRRRSDVRHRSAITCESYAVRSSRARGPWCGTVPWASSRRRRSTPARTRSRRRWRAPLRPAPRPSSAAAIPRRPSKRMRPREPHEPRLHRRRRVARVPRRKGLPWRRRARRSEQPRCEIPSSPRTGK